MLYVGARTHSITHSTSAAVSEDGDYRIVYTRTQYIIRKEYTRYVVSCGEEKKSGKPVFGKLRFLTHVKRKTAQ